MKKIKQNMLIVEVITNTEKRVIEVQQSKEMWSVCLTEVYSRTNIMRNHEKAHCEIY